MAGLLLVGGSRAVDLFLFETTNQIMQQDMQIIIGMVIPPTAPPTMPPISKINIIINN